MAEIKKCMYAGDPNDEFCSKCSGLTVLDDDGNELPADRCGGYAPAQEEAPAAEEGGEASETVGDSPATASPGLEGVTGVTTVIRAESGVSREVNGQWFKFLFSEERVLPEGSDIEAEKAALWDAVNAQVDEQMAQVVNMTKK